MQYKNNNFYSAVSESFTKRSVLAHKNIIIILILVMASFIYAAGYAYIRNQSNSLATAYDKIAVSETLPKLSSSIKMVYQKCDDYLNIMSNFVSLKPDFTYKEFEQFADSLMQRSSAVINVKVAPQGIISYSYSKTNFDDGMNNGYNLFNPLKSQEMLEGLIKRGKIMTTGPYREDDGRHILYKTESVFIKNMFWGNVMICLDLKRVLNESGFKPKDTKFFYAIKITPDNGSQSFISGNVKFFNDDSPLTYFWRDHYSDQMLDFALRIRNPQSEKGLITYNDTFAIAIGLISLLLLYLHLSLYFESRKRSVLDQMTQIYNHSTFIDILKTIKKDEKHKHALFLIDLNKFKTINDSYGHPVGDLVIMEFASRLRKTVRHDDILARLGGDEFAILARNIRSAGDVETIRNHIMDTVTEPVEIEKNVFLQISLSLGCAFFPEESTNIDDLYKLADTRMYTDKDSKRDFIPTIVGN
ncbi:MAG TPA: hypothetical protein DCR21_02530 [Succinivibrionaceae bacterium]|nr:hypothetical protein [Succinivibrionaceae bacterium]